VSLCPPQITTEMKHLKLQGGTEHLELCTCGCDYLVFIALPMLPMCLHGVVVKPGGNLPFH
jgi:hypothetical protein